MSDEFLAVDCVVLGFGIAAVGAALELVSQGRSTIVICYSNDLVCLRSMVIVLPTPLTKQQVSGDEFERIAEHALANAGILLVEGYFLSVNWSDKFELCFEEWFPSRRIVVETDRIIFAPAGTDPIVSMRPDLREFYGLGLSTNAWSDASFYKGKHVALIGCGSRAVEQCYYVSLFTSTMTLFCEQARLTPVAERWLEQMPKPFQLEYQFGVHFLGVLPDERGHLRQIVVREGSRERMLDFPALFFAQDLVPDWSIFGSQEQVSDLIARRVLIPAGLAAGVPYDDHERLFNDGMRAARECA